MSAWRWFRLFLHPLVEGEAGTADWPRGLSRKRFSRGGGWEWTGGSCGNQEGHGAGPDLLEEGLQRASKWSAGTAIRLFCKGTGVGQLTSPPQQGPADPGTS